VLQLAAVGGLRDDDPVERPDRVEVELLGERRQLLELLDRDLVAEVRQVERELHRNGLLLGADAATIHVYSSRSARLTTLP
jgi:hypothetical protein